MIRNEGAKIQTKCQSQEKVLAELGYKYRKEEVKNRNLVQQAEQYKRNLHNIENDFTTINKERKILDEKLRLKNIEIEHLHINQKTLEKEK